MNSVESFRSIHVESIVVDAHNDTIVAHKRLGLSLKVESEKVQLDLPKMRRGGIDVAFFAVDVTSAFKTHLRYALDSFGYFYKEVDALEGKLSIVHKADDIERVTGEGGVAAVLAIENSDALEGSLNVLRILYEVGVRSIGLTHNPRSLAADGVGEARTGGGLTNFGVELIKEMNRLGILVDLAHISERGFWDALEVSRKPPIVSHGNCKALCNHRRNLSDDQIVGLADKGGVICVTFVPAFVDEKKPTLERLLDHIDHIVEIAGVDHVGVGSDFDGGGTLLKDATEMPKITAGLLKRGYSEREVRMVLGENLLKVISENLSV